MPQQITINKLQIIMNRVREISQTQFNSMFEFSKLTQGIVQIIYFPSVDQIDFLNCSSLTGSFIGVINQFESKA